jgi:dTDP-glucose 4,6-dehydratase
VPVPPASTIPFIRQVYPHPKWINRILERFKLKILVTGGAGFIGGEFTRQSLKGAYKNLGFEVKELTVVDSLTYASNLDNLSEVKSDQRFKFIQGDIRDKELINKLVEDHDLIFNFAAESHVDRSIDDSSDFMTTNILGTVNILEALRKFSHKKLIQISTDEVYGSIMKGSWKEDSQIDPKSPYSASKASADLICMAYRNTYAIDVRITRSCNNYGYFQNAEKYLPKLLLNLSNDKNLLVYGEGKNCREWIHVSDNCLGIAIVATKGSAGNIYNIGSGFELSNLDLAKFVLNLSETSNSQIEFIKDRAGHDFRYSVDYSKISDLGFQPKLKFYESVAKLFNELNRFR